MRNEIWFVQCLGRGCWERSWARRRAVERFRGGFRSTMVSSNQFIQTLCVSTGVVGCRAMGMGSLIVGSKRLVMLLDRAEVRCCATRSKHNRLKLENWSLTTHYDHQTLTDHQISEGEGDHLFMSPVDITKGDKEEEDRISPTPTLTLEHTSEGIK